jgi:hypothetical protein
VFHVDDLDVFTLEDDEMWNLFFGPIEEEDYKTIEFDNSGQVIKGSVRTLIRLIGSMEGMLEYVMGFFHSFADNSDFHTTFFTIYDYFINAATLLKVFAIIIRRALTC